MEPTKFQFERFEQEKIRLASLRTYESLVSDTDEDLDKLVRIAAFICQTPISLVNLVEANHTIFKAAIGTDMHGSPREISFCSKAILESGVFEVQDASLDERFKNNPLVTGETAIRFYAGSPLVNKEGMKMGTLCVFDQQPKILSPEQKEALSTLGRMAVIVMESRKQSVMLQKGNLPAIINLQNQVTDLMKQLESFRKFLPIEVAGALKPNNQSLESSSVSKYMVVLQCVVCHYMDSDTAAGAVFFTKLYETINEVVSSYGGFVHQFDGNKITALFSEPLATFPFEDKALYCAFELKEQFTSLIKKEQVSSEVSLVISLHSGKVFSVIVSLPTRIDYTILGRVLDESKRVRDELVTPESVVLMSEVFHGKLHETIDIVNAYSVEEAGNTIKVFEVVSHQKSAV